MTTSTKKHVYIVKNNTYQILHFAIEQNLDTHTLHIYVAESEHILKNIFAERYYAALNPEQNMRLEAESPEVDIKSFTISFEIKSVLNVYDDFKEYVITVIQKSVPGQSN